MKKQLKRFISVSLIVCICTVIGSSFMPEPIPDGKQKTNSTVTVHATGADAVVTEVTSAWLLELLASLGISAETYGLLSSKSKVEWQIEQLEKYRPEGYVSSFASSSSGSGSGCSVINDFTNQVSYKITHSDAAVSKTLSDGFISRLEKALTNPKAAEEFQKLIEAAQNGLEITGGMVKNLWLMLTKGAIDDHNALAEERYNEIVSSWNVNFDIFNYNNWLPEMQRVYQMGYTQYVFYTYWDRYSIVLFNGDISLDLESKLIVNHSQDYYVFTFLRFDEYFDRSKYFPDNLMAGWNDAFDPYDTGIIDIESCRGRYDTFSSSADGDELGHKYDTIFFFQNEMTDYIFDFPVPGHITDDTTGDTAEDKPYIVNPSDVITELPEKIANDDVISIPDGTTIEDIAVPLPGDVVDDPALPGVGTPTLVGEIVGDLVPVDDIDFPWENVANPDLPVDPSVPADPAVPANPDYELDPKDYKIKPIIIEKFPFCIPWDVVKCVSLLGQTPEVPKFEYRFYIKSLNIDETIVLDLKDFEPVANVSRWFFRILFIFGLAVATRNLIRG